jgi:GT2 family glycosyltransferase
MNRVTASLVLYNTPQYQLVRLLESLEASSMRPELFIVDNSPVSMPPPPAADWITYIRSERNWGYGAGHNIALKRVLEYSDFHFVLNPDVYFGSFELERMLTYVEQEATIGLLMPKVLYPDGSVQYLCKLLPTPFDLLIRRFLPSRFAWMMKKGRDKFELRFTGYTKEMDVPYLSGCFMLLRTEALKRVGLFDERFFMYPEDLDLSRRIHAEFRSVYFPGATVVHDHARASYRNWRSLWVHMTNMIKYFNKWGWVRDASRRRTNRETLARLRM